jgi:hypothetical protein
MEQEITFNRDATSTKGKRIFGPTDTEPQLVVTGNWVENGDWEVEWLNDSKTEGECALNKGYTFKYLFHTKGGSDYNAELSAARDYINNQLEDGKSLIDSVCTTS